MTEVMKELALLVLALFATVNAFHNASNCTEEFHMILEKAAEIKSHCNIRGFYDCCEAKGAAKLAHFDSSANGIYDVINVCSSEDEEIGSNSIQPLMKVLCDMDTDGGGWTVILKRKKTVFTRVNFNRPWDQYENGFGSLHTEFWLGLRNIHCLTTRYDVDLIIDLKEDNGNGMTWFYRDFKVNGSNDKYRLEIGGGEGPTGANDAMSYHNGAQFSTYDSDNDMNVGDCASGYQTGWWFNKDCVRKGALLTGSYIDYRPHAYMQLRISKYTIHTLVDSNTMNTCLATPYVNKKLCLR